MKTNVTKYQILIIDNVLEYLSQLYQYADVLLMLAEPFGDGLHNILEAIVFGSKVILWT